MGDQVPTSFLKVHITVSPKPGKHHVDFANYRPISLLNLKLKLVATFLAKCLRPLLSQLIGPEQSGLCHAGRQKIMLSRH